MPYYDFRCEDCNTVTTVKLSLKELENKPEIECKHCKSKNTKRYYQPISITTSPKKQEFMGCGNNCQCR